jgi:hypothetical protein
LIPRGEQSHRDYRKTVILYGKGSQRGAWKWGGRILGEEDIGLYGERDS